MSATLMRERDEAVARAEQAEAKLATIAAACTEAEQLSASTLGGIPPKVTAKHLRQILAEVA